MGTIRNKFDKIGPHGINVTVVHPGVTHTEMTGPKYEESAREEGIDIAEEVADVVAFLTSPRSVSISGDAIAVGGGMLGTINY